MSRRAMQAPRYTNFLDRMHQPDVRCVAKSIVSLEEAHQRDATSVMTLSETTGSPTDSSPLDATEPRASELWEERDVPSRPPVRNLSPTVRCPSQRNQVPRRSSTPRISVSLDPDDHARMCALAESSQRSLGWVLRYALKRLLHEVQEKQLEFPLTSINPIARSEDLVRLDEVTAQLKGINWCQPRRRFSFGPHGLHPYATRFAPEIPATFIQALAKPGETVLDPFCGSGTTLLEAIRLRRNAVGVDISPLATLISRVKCTPLGNKERKAIGGSLAWAKTLVRSFYNQKRMGDGQPGQLLLDIRDHWLKFGIERPSVIPDPSTIANLAEWFQPEAIYELSLIRDVLEQCPLQAAKDFGMVALSSIILSVSFQKSETRCTKIHRQLKAFETLNRWSKKVEDMLDRLSDFHSTAGPCPAQVYQADSRDLTFLKPSSADLVVTSPPYPNTYDYRSYHRLRLIWLGLENPKAQQREIGAHRAYSRTKDPLAENDYEREISIVLGSVRGVLRPGGVGVFIIGRSKIRGVHSDNEGCILRSAPRCGFRVIASIGGGSFSTLGSLYPSRSFGERGERAILLLRE